MSTTTNTPDAKDGEQVSGGHHGKGSMARPEYEALDGQGRAYLRNARVVGELPSAQDRAAALESATQEVAKLMQVCAQRRIPFGAPVFVAFGLTRPQAKIHVHAELLLTKGCDLSLDYCPEYS